MSKIDFKNPEAAKEAYDKLTEENTTLTKNIEEKDAEIANLKTASEEKDAEISKVTAESKSEIERLSRELSAAKQVKSDNVVVEFEKAKYEVKLQKFSFQQKDYEAKDLKTNKELFKTLLEMEVPFIVKLK